MYAFSNCTALKAIILPENLKTIKAFCFAYSGLTGIQFPSSLEIIEEEAFSECKDLIKVIFAEGSKLSEIEPSAFQGCTNLKDINLPKGL